MLWNSLCMGSASIQVLFYTAWYSPSNDRGAVSYSPVVFILARKSITIYIYFIHWSTSKLSMVQWLRCRTVILTTGWWHGSNPDRGYTYICKCFVLNWEYFISNCSFFASSKIYKQLILRYFNAPESNNRGILFLSCMFVCLSVCLSVCLLSTVPFAITSEPQEVETSYLACILH